MNADSCRFIEGGQSPSARIRKNLFFSSILFIMAYRYKNLFFDLDDTLWAFSQNAHDTFEEMYRKYGYDSFFRDFHHFYTLYQQRNVELWEEYGNGQLTKDELNRQRFLYPLEAVGGRRCCFGTKICRRLFLCYPYEERADALCARSAGVSVGQIQSVHPF